MARPSAPVRYLVLVAAVVCLLCAVCARTQKPGPAKSAEPAAQPNPEANPSADQADAGLPQIKVKPRKDFMPATKAPGYIIPR